MDFAILMVGLTILVETTLLVFQKIKAARYGRRRIYVDSSALIDGRILEVARSGFLTGDLIILKSVLLELQLLADNKDYDKRIKGRAGLNAVAELERVVSVNTEIVDDTGGIKKVDEELLKYAKDNRGLIFTTDYNLIKVAEAEKIGTLNVNDLAMAVRRDFHPGDKLNVKITEKGANKGQGVGHTPNGMMVVVENGATRIGQEVFAEVLRSHESSSGQILFTRIVKVKK